eukprot:scaffold23831_cov194-Isochrysis_galbana.AAC.3
MEGGLEPGHPDAPLAPLALDGRRVNRVGLLGVACALVRVSHVQVDLQGIRLGECPLEEHAERVGVAELLLQVEQRRPHVEPLGLGRERDGPERALAHLARAVGLGKGELQADVVDPQPRVCRRAEQQTLKVVGGARLTRCQLGLARPHLRLALAVARLLARLPAATALSRLGLVRRACAAGRRRGEVGP